MVNQQVLEGNWNQLKGKVQQKWAQLTDNDLGNFHGNYEESIGAIQKKTGEGREAIENYLSQLSESAGGFASHAAGTARQYARQVSDTFRDSSQRAAEEYQEGIEGVREFVRYRPGQALGICFGAGLLLGSIVALRWRK
jgi:uncharacterized protein YjbJ (UPF0337 family)